MSPADLYLAATIARHREDSSNHTLWQSRHNTWLQTNIDEQIRYVPRSLLRDEILALKIWRRRHSLYFPCFIWN